MSLSAVLLASASFSRIASWILAAVAVFLFFSISILVHEGGHFLAARLLGLRADAFSLGFGPILLKRSWRGTEFRFCAIPFGGYVALPQLDPAGMSRVQGKSPSQSDKAETEAADAAPSAFEPAAWWKRVIVSVAGPAGNLILAVPLAFFVSVLPPVADPRLDFGGALVGAVEPDSDADAAGFRPGDQILSVADRRVSSWADFVQEVHLLSGDGAFSIAVSNRFDGAARVVTPVASRSSAGTWRVDGLAQAEPVGVGVVFPDGAAAAAGLKEGDAILSVGGTRCVSREHLFSLVRDSVTTGGGDAVALSVLRGGKSVEVRLDAAEAVNASDRPSNGCLAVGVVPGGAAEAAGMRPGDVVLAVGGAEVKSPDHFVSLVRECGGAALALDVVSAPWTGVVSRIEVVPGVRRDPESGETVPFAGLALAAPDGADAELAALGFVAASVNASVPVWSRHRAPLAQLKGDAAAVWRVFSPLFGSRHKGELKRVGTSLGGPVLILSSMWMWVLANFSAALGFVRFLNVNLAMVNLLPIPVLDGGHVVFALWRGVTGHEIPRRVVETLVNAFGVLLIGLFVLLSGCDAARLWRMFG